MTFAVKAAEVAGLEQALRVEGLGLLGFRDLGLFGFRVSGVFWVWGLLGLGFRGLGLPKISSPFPFVGGCRWFLGFGALVCSKVSGFSVQG